MKTYPSCAPPVQIQKASGAWDLFTDIVEVIPKNTITNQFIILGITVSNISANGDYELRVFIGDAGSEVFYMDIPFARTTATSQEREYRNDKKIIPANSRISMALTSSNVTQDTCDVKISYTEVN